MLTCNDDLFVRGFAGSSKKAVLLAALKDAIFVIFILAVAQMIMRKMSQQQTAERARYFPQGSGEAKKKKNRAKSGCVNR